MAPLPKTTIQHFTHPKHPLTVYDSNTKYLCYGCKIPGIGKRYRCHGCEFDLHEYCGICPTILSSFMHLNHSLKLVVRKPQGNRQFDRICNICCDSVEGLFYRCEVCEFDVHPLCTQLPETLRHALHQAHPLRLLGSSEAGTCAVCRGACNASTWRYRCQLCKFDIHMGCLMVQCEKKTSSDRGIPTYVPPSVFPQAQPQHFGGYAYGVPYWNPNSSPSFPSPSNMHHYNAPQPQYQSSGRIGQVMFGLVKTLGVGVISNMIFGVDVSPLFAV
nr:uncharacterized protein LOC104097843 [Nicotiana tomentosiformis]